VREHPQSGHQVSTEIRRRRRRDRRGRGLRGPLAPQGVPLALSRSERFDEFVLDAVERLERRWPQLSEVEFAVEDVPPEESATWSGTPVPLARLLRATAKMPARIVLFRRPLERLAAGRTELGSLVHDVVVEEVAELLGLDPESIDPHYGEE
jgi:predicted Zn-dependent protease with MMP-like domain